jgi:hypothetical protein
MQPVLNAVRVLHPPAAPGAAGAATEGVTLSEDGASTDVRCEFEHADSHRLAMIESATYILTAASPVSGTCTVANAPNVSARRCTRCAAGRRGSS